MKQLYLFLFSVLSLFCFSSCQDDKLDDAELMVTTRFLIAGEVTEVYYSPITRADGEASVLLCKVFVFDGETNSYVDYAYGAFDKLSGIIIDLPEGAKYKIIASYVPYYMLDRRWTSRIGQGFSIGKYDMYLYTGAFSVGPEYTTYHPFSERYYCETEFVASENQTISLYLKRCSTKMSLTANNLIVGKIRADVQFEEDDWHNKLSVEVTADTPTNETLFSFKDATLCWNNDEYVEKYNVSFYYLLGDSETLIETRELTFYRNTITNVIVTINNTLGGNGHYLDFNLDNDYSTGETININFSL